MADQNTSETKKIYELHLEVIFSDFEAIKTRFIEKNGREPSHDDMASIRHRREKFLNALPGVLKEMFRTETVRLKNAGKMDGWDQKGFLYSNGENIFRMLVEGHSLKEEAYPRYAESKKLIHECDGIDVKYTMQREGPMLRYEQWLRENGQPEHVQETITFH